MKERRRHSLRFQWPVVKAAVGADRVVLSPPVLDKDLGLLQRKEYLPIQQFIFKLCSEILRFRQISPTFIPYAKATSASLSIPISFSVLKSFRLMLTSRILVPHYARIF
jgi:hypothetical protein